MKYTPITLILLIGILCSIRIHAQGWSWARGNTGGGIDAWAVATDPSGNVFAAGVALGSTMGNSAYFGSVSVPYSTTTSFALGGYQCVIVKYDGAGNVLWASGTQNGDAWLMNIAADNQGNCFMFGCLNSKTINIGPYTITNTIYPKSQYFLTKYDASGNVVWVKNEGNVITGSSGTSGITASILGTGAVTTDDAGNIFITSAFQLPTTTIGGTTLVNANASGYTTDIFIAKYDPSGNVIWAKSYGGTASDNAYGIAVTHSGDIYIAGVFGSATITFGPSVITNTAPLIAGGQVAYIARFDASGSAIWASASGGTGGEYAVGLACDLSDNVYLTGGLKDNSIAFSGTTIANPTPGQAVLYLVKFNTSNNVSWYKTIYSATRSATPDSASVKESGTWGYSIATSPCGSVWVSGAFTDSVYIDSGILRSPRVNLNNQHADPVYMVGYNTYGSCLASAALASGGDDQNGIACDQKGNLYMSCDYVGDLFFSAGADTLPTGAGEEYLYLAKYPFLKTNSAINHSSQTQCINDSMVVTAPGGYATRAWNGGNNTAPSFTVKDTGVYWVCSFDSCVSSSYDTFIFDRNCVCGKTLFLPNSFTPNGDGENDVFYPRSSNDIALIQSFQVYNRWGELLFERINIMPNDVQNAWDGSYSGDKPRPDVYVWVVGAQCDNGSIIRRKGSVTIIR